MIRILVFGVTENPGGVESFLIGYYRQLNREKIQFDFLCNTYETIAYEEEILSLGGRIYRTTPRSSNPFRFKKELNAIFKEHSSEWSAIWVNVCSLANIDYLKLAKKFGIKRRIIHSHNSRNMDSNLRGKLHEMNKKKLDQWATDFWACSEDAAKWFFKDELLPKSIVIHNAIDVERMRFDEEKKEALRLQYGWQDKYVIGNVGRLHFQKNQDFMIDVFKEYHVSHPESVLVLVGQGEDENKLKEKVKSYELTQNVIFAGVQKDIQGWLSCFDLFLFPSVFEGLSIAALEAQANGIPVLASTGVIPEEVKINDNFHFFSLEKSAAEWATQIEEIPKTSRKSYEDVKNGFVQKGFDIKTEAEKLEELLIG